MEIAIIAHDGKKAEMVQFLNEQKAFLKKNEITLVSTGTTGNKVELAGFKVTKFLSGPLGGDAQIAARAAEGKCDMVIFFRDPLEKHPHEPDIFMLMRICDVYDVPLATNPATASMLFKGLIVSQLRPSELNK
ncbi:MAG: methylglyoxal synthase [Crocinitomicaceae bacterium]|jgi:methylglyoxal synthase|nr:methylglyoxal synthase [Crocinitomicaceae bacterium]MDG1658265.1 methylglyoxal synthase [Crocinitomicaceae bacterium]|tara:strand:+ start:6 stop:404 length:399 start_codon:yes stop_codon:yes gene_type:complete